ncbi:MAG TPA: lipoyl synthase [Clostridia bacterium]|nr:lipoyl synthase [Clostridia bacterium]
MNRLHQRKPKWLKVKIENLQQIKETKEMLQRLSLHTVCQEALCPNLVECFGRKTATFMILGKHCTRNCTFCNVTKQKPEAVDPLEPEHVAQAVVELGLKHVVITSVTRDDLPDGGAGHFAAVINRVREVAPGVTVEVLIPDFQGSEEALLTVIQAKPEIINHNVETVPRLYPAVRPLADYHRSLELLANVKKHSTIYTKSGIMVGLGETQAEVEEVLKDLRSMDCDLLTIGQYLAPSAKHHPVVEYIEPAQFDEYKRIAEELGFKYVISKPLARSSYHADIAGDVVL